MEDLREHGLDECHRQLMAEIRGGASTLSAELRQRIDAMGIVTREVLVNAAETDPPKETPLMAACASHQLAIVDALLDWFADPSAELFQRLIDVQSPANDQLIGRIVEYAKELTAQFAFLLACIRGNEPAVVQFIRAGMPLAASDALQLRTEIPLLYDSKLRGVMNHVASKGSVTLVRLLDPCIVMSKAPLFESLYLTAAFYGHLPLVQYLLKRMEASPEAFERAYEVLGAQRMLFGYHADALNFWKLSGRDRLELFNGDIKYLLRLELQPPEYADPYIKALTIVEKHFRHRQEFCEALLIRPYTVQVTIYALDVIMHDKKITSENLAILRKQLVDMSFTENRETLPVMKCIEWCIAAIDYLPDANNPLHVAEQEDDDDLDESIKQLEDLKLRLKHAECPPPTPASFQELAEFSCWLLMRLENVADFDPKREWFAFMLRRLIRISKPWSSTFSLPHRLLEMHLAAPGKHSIFETLIGAKADLSATDGQGDTLIHKVVKAYDDGVEAARDVLETLVKSVPIDTVNSDGVSAADDVTRILGWTPQ